jgi:peptidoglycan/xylan/chitin deacetylase (PgdA/CDA1 family)
LKAVLFICTQLATTTDVRGYDADHRFMGWDELAEALAQGHTVAPHGETHRSLGRMPIAAAIEEIDRARAALELRLGIRTPFFSFPFGTRADYPPPPVAALTARNFRHRFAAIPGRGVPGSRSVVLPRIKIEGGDESDLLPDIVRGGIDHWRIVDYLLYPFQQRGRM